MLLVNELKNLIVSVFDLSNVSALVMLLLQSLATSEELEGLNVVRQHKLSALSRFDRFNIKGRDLLPGLSSIVTNLQIIRLDLVTFGLVTHEPKLRGLGFVNLQIHHHT